jgi:uncharacterized protein
LQGFTVPVAEILGRAGEYRELKIDSPLLGVETPLSRLKEETPLRGDLRAESVVEGILVTGRLKGSAKLTCARCLKNFSAPMGIEVCELYAGPGHELPPEEDAYKVEGLEIDLEPMLRDALVLDLPLNPVCKQDCKGRCAHCGQDLNEGACACKEEDVDPRWAALSALRDQLEEA